MEVFAVELQNNAEETLLYSTKLCYRANGYDLITFFIGLAIIGNKLKTPSGFFSYNRKLDGVICT